MTDKFIYMSRFENVLIVTKIPGKKEEKKKRIKNDVNEIVILL